VRAGQERIRNVDVDGALDRLTVGMSKSTGTANRKRQELVAWHEAGGGRRGASTRGRGRRERRSGPQATRSWPR